MDSRHQPPGSEPGALLIELQGKMIRQPELHRSLADTSGVRRSQRFGGINEMIGHTGAAPAICRCGGGAVSPRWSARPDLHRVRAGLQSAASSASASRAFCNGVTAGIRTRIFWFTARNSGLLSYGHSFFLCGGKGILRSALPRHRLLYERSALLASATEEFEMMLPRGLAPRASAFAKRRAGLLHFGS